MADDTNPGALVPLGLVQVREPGARFLSNPDPAWVEAQKDWEYALLAQVAYSNIRGVRDTYFRRALIHLRLRKRDKDAPDPTTARKAVIDLCNAGWRPWEDFPRGALLMQLNISHLRAEVWEKRIPPTIAVAFGGTVATSGKDWLSNLRWLIPIPFRKDEYTEVVTTLAPSFSAEYLKLSAEPDREHLRGATLHSTGHSLGGGLAQQFAYALPLHAARPRVTHVYAFDSSPVTGYYSVDRATRKANSKGLETDRIYEKGEILSYLRAGLRFFRPPSRINPAIREVRYDLFRASNPIAGHSITELASKIYENRSLQLLEHR